MPAHPTAPEDEIRYVFLDRDGVINRKMPEGRWVTSPDELVLCPGAASAISRLNEANIKAIVVTNQRGIALGVYSEADLGRIHDRLRTLLNAENAHIDAIYYCPHARDICQCRKPKPGMFLQAFQDFPSATPANSLLIGDSLSDIEAGSNLGMKTAFVDGDPSTQADGALKARSLATYQASTLQHFVDELFRRQKY